MLLQILVMGALYLVQLVPIIVTLVEVMPPPAFHVLKVHIQIVEVVFYNVLNAHIA